MTERPANTARRWYAAAAVGVAAFVAYGSLVPFEFHARAWSDAVESFRWAMIHRIWPASRSDWLANVMLGVPLGFFLLGAARAGSPGRVWPTLTASLLLWPACVGLAVMVEFGQLYVPGRTCSGSDVLAQGLGAAVGMIGWAEFGPRLTRWLTSTFGRKLIARLSGLYVGALGLILYMPLDLTLSPHDIARELLRQVVYVPFAEFEGWNSPAGREQLQHWAELAGVYLPGGLLAARIGNLSGRLSRRVAAVMIAFPFVMEAGQLFVASHVPQASGVIVGLVGVLAGWCLGQWFRRGLDHYDGRRPARGLGGVARRDHVAAVRLRPEPLHGTIRVAAVGRNCVARLFALGRAVADPDIAVRPGRDHRCRGR